MTPQQIADTAAAALAELVGPNGRYLDEEGLVGHRVSGAWAKQRGVPCAQATAGNVSVRYIEFGGANAYRLDVLYV